MAKDEQALARELVQRIAKPYDVGAGFIGALGEWVLRKACEDAAAWPGYIGLAVNISPSQCTPALTQTVMNALAASRLTPGQLELEITETALLQDSSTTVSVLHLEQFEQVRDAGCTQCQGYYFGRPMPLEEVQKLLHRRRANIRKPGFA